MNRDKKPIEVARDALRSRLPAEIIEALQALPLPGGRQGVRARVQVGKGLDFLVLVADDAGPLRPDDVRLVNQLLQAYVVPAGVHLDVRPDPEAIALPRSRRAVGTVGRAAMRLLGAGVGVGVGGRARSLFAALGARWRS